MTKKYTLDTSYRIREPLQVTDLYKLVKKREFDEEFKGGSVNGGRPVMSYLIYKNSNWTGPFSTEEIKRMVTNGTATTDDYVCLENDNHPHQIKVIPDLFIKPSVPPMPIVSPTTTAKKPETFKDHQAAIKNSMDQLVAAGKDDSKKGWHGCLTLIVIGFIILWGIANITKKDGASGPVDSKTQISSAGQNSMETVGKWKMTFRQSGTADDPVFEYKTNPIQAVSYNRDANGEIIGGSFPALEALREITTKILQFIKANENLNSLTLKITVTQGNTYEQDRYGNETTIKHPDVVRVLTLSNERLADFRKYKDAEYLEKGERDIDDLSNLLGGESKR